MRLYSFENESEKYELNLHNIESNFKTAISSHRKLWKYILTHSGDKNNIFMITSDGIVLEDNALIRLSTVISNTPDDWDILFLLPAEKDTDILDESINDHVMKVKEPNWTAYLIKKSSIKRNLYRSSKKILKTCKCYTVRDSFVKLEDETYDMEVPYLLSRLFVDNEDYRQSLFKIGKFSMNTYTVIIIFASLCSRFVSLIYAILLGLALFLPDIISMNPMVLVWLGLYIFFRLI